MNETLFGMPERTQLQEKNMTDQEVKEQHTPELVHSSRRSMVALFAWVIVTIGVVGVLENLCRYLGGDTGVLIGNGASFLVIGTMWTIATRKIANPFIRWAGGGLVIVGASKIGQEVGRHFAGASGATWGWWIAVGVGVGIFALLGSILAQKQS